MNYALLAAWLGEPYYDIHVYDGEDYVCVDGQNGVRPISDADLVMAVLEKLKLDDALPSLADMDSHWQCRAMEDGEFMLGNGPTPIAAICALVVALEKP